MEIKGMSDVKIENKIMEKKGRANQVDHLVSKRLRIRRLVLGLSQVDLSKAVDVSIQQIQKYEKAKNRISSGKLYAFSKFLKVPVTYFYQDNLLDPAYESRLFAEEEVEEDEEDEHQDHPDKYPSEKEIINLIKVFSEIDNKETRKKVIELVRTIS